MDIIVYGIISTLVALMMAGLTLIVREARELQKLCAGASLSNAISKANRDEPLTEAEKWTLVRHYIVLHPAWAVKGLPEPTEQLTKPLRLYKPTGWDRWSDSWIRTAAQTQRA